MIAHLAGHEMRYWVICSQLPHLSAEPYLPPPTLRHSAPPSYSWQVLGTCIYGLCHQPPMERRKRCYLSGSRSAEQDASSCNMSYNDWRPYIGWVVPVTYLEAPWPATYHHHWPRHSVHLWVPGICLSTPTRSKEAIHYIPPPDWWSNGKN